MKKLFTAITMIALCLSAEGLAQVSSLGLLIEDNETSGTPNTITLAAPATADLTTNYTLRLPNATGLVPGSLLYVGSGAGSVFATNWLAPGGGTQVLQMNGGMPSWQTINTLPNGIGTNTFLVWNGTTWVPNGNLSSDPANGNTTIGGDLTVSGTNVNLPAGSIDNTELANSSINVSYGSGVSGSATVALGGTLNLQNTGLLAAAAGTGIGVSTVAGTATISNTGLLAATAGSGIGVSTTAGNVTISNTGVLSVTGTTNQVTAAPTSGAVVLSLPQNIHTGASPTFVGATLTGLATGSTATDVVVSNGGVLQTRSLSTIGVSGSEPFITFAAGSTGLTDNRVLTAGTGIGLANAGADNGAMTISNTGVTNAVAGAGIGVSGGTGSVTFTNTGVTNLTAGTGISVSGGTGSVTVNNTGVLSVTGTTNQVTATPTSGAVVLTLPQDIHTNATPTFDGLTLDNLTQDNAQSRILVQNASGQTFWRDASSLTSGPTGWALTGNAIAGTEFLGTTNAQPLIIKTNDTEAMRVLSGGNVGIGTPTPGQKLEVMNGNVLLNNSNNTAAELHLAEPSGSGAHLSAFKAQAQAGDITYVLPDTAGKAGDFLAVKTLSSGVATLDWATPNESTTTGQLLFKRKTADEEKTSNDSLRDDAHLSFDLEANHTYEISGALYAIRTGGNVSKMDVAWVVPGGTGTGAANSTMLLSFIANEAKSGNSNTGGDLRSTSGEGSTNNVTYTDIGINGTTIVVVHFKGLVKTGTTAGPFTLRWTGTVNGSTQKVTLKANSYMTADLVE